VDESAPAPARFGGHRVNTVLVLLFQLRRKWEPLGIYHDSVKMMTVIGHGQSAGS
jgi:hypothetical protein